jgi:hypothetical protein
VHFSSSSALPENKPLEEEACNWAGEGVRHRDDIELIKSAGEDDWDLGAVGVVGENELEGEGVEGGENCSNILTRHQRKEIVKILINRYCFRISDYFHTSVK